MSVKLPASKLNNENKSAFSILIVDDETEICNFLSRALRKYYSVVDIAHNTAQANVLVKEKIYDLLIVDINMPEQSGIDWLASSQPEINNSATILMTGFADIEHAVAAVRLGVVDFILKPFRLEQMLKAVERSYNALCLSRENNAYKHRLARQDDCSSIIGSSKLMTKVNQLIARVASTKSSVLIEGETGTGKELVANAIHDLSGREGAFVAINCAAIAAELIESELFGHVKGAFTHAIAREGLFSYADGGTLFLDEISEMPMALQSKLLRVLEEGKIRPVGSNKEKTIDVRIVTACNKPLAPLIEKQLFREDLFYRLNILPITLPGLRERPEDIQPLSTHFLKQLADDLALPAISIDREDLDIMQCYSWPGNVRELRNLLERAMLLDSSPKQLLKELVEAQQPEVNASYPVNWTLHKVQLEHIEKVLASCHNNKSQAAGVLGITRKTLDRKRAHKESCVAFK
jgi:DNA-binding NtrC family response regulator